MEELRSTDLESGQIGLVFLEVNPEGSLGSELIYGPKNLKHARVGSVYDIEIDPANPRSIYPNTLRWLRLWEDQVQASVWQTLADAFDTRDLAIHQERKETGGKLPLELLAPLREEYWSTNAVGRLAIEVRVLAYLRGTKIIAK
jgi:hypothetical protein